MSKWKRGSPLPAARMSQDEKMVVQFIVTRLYSASCSSNGKPAYSASLDQVMKDLFGMKRFSKTLQRARYNEPLMIELMRRVNTKALWNICRSNEHYRMFCTLVALDADMMHSQRKMRKLMEQAPQEREVGKIRKLEKGIKRSRKMYREVINTLCAVFSIDKVENDPRRRMLSRMEEYVSRYGYEDDIFGVGGPIFDDDAVASMDAYVRSRSGGHKAPRNGALDIFGDDTGFDPDDGDIFDSVEGSEDEGDDDLDDNFARLANIMESGFNSMNHAINGLISTIMNGGLGEMDEVPIGSSNGFGGTSAPYYGGTAPVSQPSAAQAPTVADLMAWTEAHRQSMAGEDADTTEQVPPVVDTSGEEG